jgi:hypothetical protein
MLGSFACSPSRQPFVEPDRLVEHAALEALVGELRAVVHARAHRDLLGAALELAVGIERLGDVAHVLAHRARLARLREHFHEVVGEAAHDREDDDDRHPHPAAAGLHRVEGERELDDPEKHVEESHGRSLFLGPYFPGSALAKL